VTKERYSGLESGERFCACCRLLALLCLALTHTPRARAAVPRPCPAGSLRKVSIPFKVSERDLRLPGWPSAGVPVRRGGIIAPREPAAPETVPPQIAQVLTGMAAQASVIFTGQVRSIAREDAHGYVDVSFTVQQALRGTSANIYVLREWAGLWIGQPERYRVGERVLLLLRSRSRSGFSSPVGGPDGAIPILRNSQPPLLDETGQVPADPGNSSQGGADPGSWRVDLRWLATRVERARSVSSAQALFALPTGSAAGSKQVEAALPAVLAALRSAPEESFDER